MTNDDSDNDDENSDVDEEDDVDDGESFLFKLVKLLAPNSSDVREFVAEIKRANPDLSVAELADVICDKRIRAYTAQGAALALPGAIPGLGTAAQITTEFGAASLDVRMMLKHQTYIAFALGELYGIKGRRQLIEDTLVCIGLWSKALTLTKAGAVRIGTKVVESSFRKKMPGEMLKAINKRVGTTVLTKYGTKRGGIALGKLIPFGVGVVVGGGFNYVTMTGFASAAKRHLELKRRT